MNVTIDNTLRGKDLFDFLIKNKSLLIAEKKSAIKHSDGLGACYVDELGHIIKTTSSSSDTGTIDRACVINTCNIRDSHKDVHIPGIWKKSLSENKDLYLCQEHSMTFKGIISDDLQAFTKTMSWKELGAKYKGETEALIFNTVISKDRNEFMYDQYRKGFVKNHSVGMQYVQIELGINDEDYKEEFAVWNKFIDQIANRDEWEKDEPYFFAVRQAKAVEGSAVPIGSNRITPTYNQFKQDTDDQPSEDTEHQPSLFDWKSAIKTTKFI